MNSINLIHNIELKIRPVENGPLPFQPLLADYEKMKNCEEGPWTKEIDIHVITWKSEELACCVLRKPHLFSLAGYVRSIIEIPIHDIDVHGCITWYNKDKEGNYWVGFDAAHVEDIVPALYKKEPAFLHEDATYKDISFMIAETIRLAEQVGAILINL